MSTAEDRHKLKLLTVSEAAESLKISEDAVRERVQCGTLRQAQTLDGYVYVCLEDEKGVAGTDPSTEESDAKGESRGRVLQLADVASLIAVVSAGTYIMGLLVFWYPISITYTGGFATAWYATTLVPRNVVIGHGVQKLLLPYLSLVLLIVANELQMAYIETRALLRDKPKYVRNIVIYAVVLLELLFLSVVLPFILESVATIPTVTVSIRLFWVIFAAFVGVVLCILLVMLRVLETRPQSARLSSVREARSFGEYLQRLRHLWRTYRRHYIALAGLFFVVISVAVFMLTILFAKPPLSRVVISGQRPVKGELLTHADGFWYVFEQREDEQEAKLVAIPDVKVKEVRISE